MTTTTTHYACISDRYQPEEGELYESVEEFLRMCDACHDERPELVERDGDYYEGGECILEAREVEVPREWGVGRDIVVKLRATEGERDAWDAAAERAGQSRSEWIRGLANGAASDDGLMAEECDDVLTVVDSAGGRWWPNSAACDEIDNSSDPEATALRICRNDPMRGEWRD